MESPQRRFWNGGCHPYPFGYAPNPHSVRRDNRLYGSSRGAGAGLKVYVSLLPALVKLGMIPHSTQPSREWCMPLASIFQASLFLDKTAEHRVLLLDMSRSATLSRSKWTFLQPQLLLHDPTRELQLRRETVRCTQVPVQRPSAATTHISFRVLSFLLISLPFSTPCSCVGQLVSISGVALGLSFFSPPRLSALGPRPVFTFHTLVPSRKYNSSSFPLLSVLKVDDLCKTTQCCFFSLCAWDISLGSFTP